MTRDSAITASILGELIPELEYAAPALLERLDRGDPLVEIRSPADLGFETGAIDLQLLALFELLVPYVKAALGYGILGILQTWTLYERGSRKQAELIEMVTSLAAENAELRRNIQQLAGLLTRAEGSQVSADEVVASIAVAADRVPAADESSPADISR